MSQPHIRHLAVLVAVPAAGQATVAILTGLAGFRRKVLAVAPVRIANLMLVAALDTDYIIESPSDFIPATADQWYPVNLELLVGQVFNLGYRDVGAGAGNRNVVIRYEQEAL